jgi:hypothetical protein
VPELLTDRLKDTHLEDDHFLKDGPATVAQKVIDESAAPIGQNEPTDEQQEKLNSPEYVNHPGQYRVISRSRGKVTVRNVGSRKLVILNLENSFDRQALADIEKYKKVRQVQAKNSQQHIAKL